MTNFPTKGLRSKRRSLFSNISGSCFTQSYRILMSALINAYFTCNYFNTCNHTSQENLTCSYEVLSILIGIKRPVFHGCPKNISLSTDPGVATTNVSWTVPTAVDWKGDPVKVTMTVPQYVPPVTFKIGRRVVDYSYGRLQPYSFLSILCRS